MQNRIFLPMPLRLYCVTAVSSVFLLFLAIVHEGNDGPFGPTLQQIASQERTPGLGADIVEIVYFASPDCGACARWKKAHLPKWRQSALSRRVPFTMRSASCGTANKYASLCRKLVDDAKGQPVFALIHWESGRVLATGKGVSGFYSVGKQAKKWHNSLSGLQTSA